MTRVDIAHLLQGRTAVTAIDQIVGEYHIERLIADHGLRAQHRVTQAEGFNLADIYTGDTGRHDVLHELQLRLLAAQGHLGFQFVGTIEMIGNRALGAAGNEHQHFGAGGHGFFHRILDQRLVHHWQHFFGAGLGCGQETRAQAGDRKHGFADSGGFHIGVFLIMRHACT